MCERVRARVHVSCRPIHTNGCIAHYSAALFVCVYFVVISFSVWLWPANRTHENGFMEWVMVRMNERWEWERDASLKFFVDRLWCAATLLQHCTCILFDIWFMCSVSSVWFKCRSLSLSPALALLLSDSNFEELTFYFMDARHSRIKVD